MNYLAQSEQNLGNPLRGFGTLGLEGQGGGSSISIFNNVISTAIGLMTIIAFIWFVFLLIAGAYGVLASGGDKAKVAEARGRLTTAAIGLVITIAAVFIADLVGTLLGIDLLGGASLIPNLVQ